MTDANLQEDNSICELKLSTEMKMKYHIESVDRPAGRKVGSISRDRQLFSPEPI